MVIEKETDTCLVLISQPSAPHLRPSPGPASTKGFLVALTHSSKTGHTKRGSRGAHKHGADPTEPCILLGSRAQPPALLSSLCTLQSVFPNQQCSGRAQGPQDELPCLVPPPRGGCQGRAAQGTWPATAACGEPAAVTKTQPY